MLVSKHHTRCWARDHNPGNNVVLLSSQHIINFRNQPPDTLHALDASPRTPAASLAHALHPCTALLLLLLPKLMRMLMLMVVMLPLLVMLLVLLLLLLMRQRLLCTRT
jgi:hypothetical protein